MGGSKQSSNASSGPSSVWQGQSPYLEALYKSAFEKMGGQVNTTAGPGSYSTSKGGEQRYNPGQQTTSYGFGQSPTPGGSAYNYAQNIAQGAGGAFGNQAQGGFSDPRMMQNLQGLGSGQFQNQALGGAIQSGLGDINRNFNQNIMPGINTGSAMTNTSGGSRQGIAQGLAASNANRQAGDFVNKMYSQNYGQMLQSMLGANQQLGGLQGQANQAQQGAMQQAPQMAGLGGTPDAAYWQQQFAPLSAFQSIIGNPAILGGGSQSSSKRLGGGVFTGG